MEEAEPLPPLSQRGFPDEMDSAALSDDDDMADCVSVISMATAVTMINCATLVLKKARTRLSVQPANENAVNEVVPLQAIVFFEDQKKLVVLWVKNIGPLLVRGLI